MHFLTFFTFSFFSSIFFVFFFLLTFSSQFVFLSLIVFSTMRHQLFTWQDYYKYTHFISSTFPFMHFLLFAFKLFFLPKNTTENYWFCLIIKRVLKCRAKTTSWWEKQWLGKRNLKIDLTEVIKLFKENPIVLKLR